MAILVDGDREIEESELVPEGISGVDDGRAGVRDCSPKPESPSDAAMEVAAVSWDAGTAASKFALRRVCGEEDLPSRFPVVSKPPEVHSHS